jgi:hypothetical protein
VSSRVLLVTWIVFLMALSDKGESSESLARLDLDIFLFKSLGALEIHPCVVTEHS